MQRLPLLALVVLLAGTAANAQGTETDHSGMDHSAMGHGGGVGAGAETPACRAFADANARMHAAMSVPMTGNADRDFLAGMIAHHEGAIAMARIELEHGRNEQARTLAEKIVAAQEAEIAEMRAILAALP